MPAMQTIPGTRLFSRADQLGQRPRQGVRGHPEVDQLVLFFRKPAVQQNPKVFRTSRGGNVQIRLQFRAGPGGSHQRADDGDAAFVGKPVGDGADVEVALWRAGSQRGLDGFEQGGCGGNLRIRFQSVDEGNALTLGLQEAAGLDAPQLLAGIGSLDADRLAQIADASAGLFLKLPEQLDAFGSGQHFAGPPQGGVEVLHDLHSFCRSLVPARRFAVNLFINKFIRADGQEVAGSASLAG